MEMYSLQEGRFVKVDQIMSYKEMSKQARKRYRKMKIKQFFDKLCCNLGIHEWETKKRLACNVPVGNTFTGRLTGTFDGETLFQQCKCCPTVRCVVTAGNLSDTFPIGITARSAIRHQPHLINDPFIKEVAQL